jgi:hypothetical protein
MGPRAILDAVVKREIRSPPLAQGQYLFIYVFIYLVSWLVTLPLSAEVKNAWSYTSTAQYVLMAWRLVKHTDNTFTFIYLFIYLLVEKRRYSSVK